MVDADRETFQKAISALATAVRGEVTSMQREFYWRSLRHASLEDSLRACERASMECRFMPVPAVLREYLPAHQNPAWRSLPPLETRPPPPEVPTAKDMAEGTAHVVGVARRQIEDCRAQLRGMEPVRDRTEMVIRLSRHLGELDSAVANHRWALALVEQHGPDYRPPLRGSSFVASPRPQPKHWSDTDREPGSDDFEERA